MQMIHTQIVQCFLLLIAYKVMLLHKYAFIFKINTHSVGLDLYSWVINSKNILFKKRLRGIEQNIRETLVNHKLLYRKF